MTEKVNLAALEEQHLSAERWEKIRAAYFTRIGKPDNATRCKLLAMHHKNCALDAAAGKQKKPGRKSKSE
jgi:hypothetical protein